MSHTANVMGGKHHNIYGNHAQCTDAMHIYIGKYFMFTLSIVHCFMNVTHNNVSVYSGIVKRKFDLNLERQIG